MLLAAGDRAGQEDGLQAAIGRVRARDRQRLNAEARRLGGRVGDNRAELRPAGRGREGQGVLLNFHDAGMARRQADRGGLNTQVDRLIVVDRGENVPVVRNLLHGAVYNAIGKWVDDGPITPEKVLKALGKA